MNEATRGVTVLHACFPTLPPMLLCGFESRLGFESSGFSMWHFLELVSQGFLRVTPVSSPPSSVNGSANKIKAQINAIPTLSNLIA